MYVDQVPDVHDFEADARDAGHPPLAALRLRLDEVAHYGRLKYGVAEVIHAATDGGADDVLLQLSVLWRINPARPGAEARAGRILDLIVDRLRATP
ncbi:hypothetical protein SAMN05216489_08064 [Streptomyces sp. 3213]|uniref:hypothetical protein n=1 Tax=Streptomyces sp. 3213.3 TaxID=1855348 RepID=UPI00089A1D06|nr:hypothetical protein [Streptomyces sp. 3213.3]SEE73372.1 hypothetical protein SAMN05216489_08064 [Streptomyces sp. 3213] [Streptomyces sp. 3213.3]